MKKIYYEVEVRIYEITSDQDDDVFEELRSFSDGFILLKYQGNLMEMNFPLRYLIIMMSIGVFLVMQMNFSFQENISSKITLRTSLFVKLLLKKK